MYKITLYKCSARRQFKSYLETFITYIATERELKDFSRNLDTTKYHIQEIILLDKPSEHNTRDWRIFLTKLPVNLELGETKRRKKDVVK